MIGAGGGLRAAAADSGNPSVADGGGGVDGFDERLAILSMTEGNRVFAFAAFCGLLDDDLSVGGGVVEG